MKFEEHKVARNVAKDEILRAIDDFRSGNPQMIECDWEEGNKKLYVCPRIFQ